jgi:Rod binding domain-containing protein
VSAEFEAVMTAALLKEGLAKAAASGAEESEGGSGTYMSFAYEQLAYHIGRQGVLGIADSITEQLGALPAEASDGLPN